MKFFGTGFLLALSLCMDIGIVNIAIIRTGIESGFSPALRLGLGSTLGDLIYACISLAGIGILLKISAVRWALWIGGTVILLYLCVHAVKNMLVKDIEQGDKLPGKREKTGNRYFTYGTLLALSSPTSILWYASIGGGIIAGESFHGKTDILIFLSGFAIASTLWGFFLAGVSHAGKKLFTQKIRIVISAISLMIFLILAFYNFIHGYRTLILGV